MNSPMPSRLQHRGGSGKKQVKGFAKPTSIHTRQDRKTAAQYLAVDQHRIAVENDEVGLDHRAPEGLSLYDHIL